MNLSPKSRFLAQTEVARIHRDAAAEGPMLLAAEASLLQLVLEETKPVATPQDAAAAYYRIVGARQSLDKLLTIADPVKKKERIADSTNLNHDA